MATKKKTTKKAATKATKAPTELTPERMRGVPNHHILAMMRQSMEEADARAACAAVLVANRVARDDEHAREQVATAVSYLEQMTGAMT